MSTPEKPIAESFPAQRFSNPIVISLLLAAATFIVFWPVRNCNFIDYDDPGYFYKNHHVLDGLTGTDIIWAFTNIETSNWHPVTWLSLMLDAQIFGNSPVGPHLTNLFFHAANAVLLFLLLHKMTQRFWACTVVAALFALHPLRVESVAWVSERKDVLSEFFGLLTLICYAEFVERSKIQNPKFKGFYILSLIMFALGLMSKPLVVTLPFVMLLLDFWPLQRVLPTKQAIRRLLLEKIPFFILSAAGCVTTFFAQEKGHAVAAMTTFPMGMRIENTFVSYARYLEKTFWPFSLATPYPHPGWWPVPTVIFSVALFVVCCLLAISFAKKFPFVFVGWFWFFGTFIPMIGLVQVGGAAMADRYSYLPLIGIYIIVIWSAAIIFERKIFPRKAIAILILLILAGLSVRTRDQIHFWKNDETLFSHANAVTENNYVALVNLGTWYSKHGQTPETLDCYYRALRMNPNDPSVLYDIGNAFGKLGNWPEAIRDYHLALGFAPESPDILNNLGFALAQQKQFPEAVTNFEAALKLKPDFADAHNNLATVLFRQGNFEAAAQHFFDAAKLEPENPQFMVNLGETFLRLGKTETAVKCYEQAAQLQPDNEKIQQRLQTLRQQRSN